MGDSEGGSSAARRAPDPQDNGYPERDYSEHESNNGHRGLFGRIIGAFNPQDDAAAEGSHGAPPGPRVVALGLAGLRRQRIEDVAIPKAEIVAVPVDIDRDALIATFRDSGFSRLPVYEETLDRPLGLLLLKDLALKYGFNGHHAFDLRPLLRPLIYAPPSMPLAALLQRMQAERTHMALMIDEYGGVDGLVTIENLLEQVVGDIDDEHDTEEEGHWTREAPGCWLMQARAPLDEVEAELALSLVAEDDRDEIDTLGGLVFVLAGRVPARGEVIRHEAGVEFEVIDADPRRIKRLRVRRTDTAPAPAPAPA